MITGLNEEGIFVVFVVPAGPIALLLPAGPIAVLLPAGPIAVLLPAGLVGARLIAAERGVVTGPDDPEFVSDLWRSAVNVCLLARAV